MPRYTLGGAPNSDPYFEPEDAEALIEWDLDTESMATLLDELSAADAEAVFEERDCFCNGGEIICSPDCYHP